LRFLGADADEKSIKRCVESASFERWSGGRKRGDEESAALLRKGVAGDWRKVFTDQDKRIYKEVAGQMLIGLGYERDYDW
jgi:Sulfotransferase domain